MLGKVNPMPRPHCATWLSLTLLAMSSISIAPAQECRRHKTDEGLREAFEHARYSLCR